MRARADFVRSLLVSTPAGTHVAPMFDRVHIDEKWFVVNKTKRRVYLTPTEPNPQRHAQHKSHLPKLMFLCAITRPRVDPATGASFDRGIGIWPFAEEIPAYRSSSNRQAGTLETKPLPANKETYKAMIMTEVVPAVVSKWPAWGGRHIVLQRDNANPHRVVTSADLTATMVTTGLSIMVECQPPQSPDLNMLDLGFFSALQSEQFKRKRAALTSWCRGFVRHSTISPARRWITRSSLYNT
ncbi:hypothetical protein PybrP1_009936 [[Pythium] brassicae (nom. inval.)]|nr:hypothetical protein PybrP1_009936 [[Pythium] brassicae (nom. inval.)]